ncbi:hypothetical protein EDB83DRAFT_1242903 [Lactarius deliciosus]|nr:hypothetical protein EDB83DRAFT_1242903 [Lactarius deliciosus]
MRREARAWRLSLRWRWLLSECVQCKRESPSRPSWSRSAALRLAVAVKSQDGLFKRQRTRPQAPAETSFAQPATPTFGHRHRKLPHLC